VLGEAFDVSQQRLGSFAERTNFATCFKIGSDPGMAWAMSSPGESGQEKKQWHEDRSNSLWPRAAHRTLELVIVQNVALISSRFHSFLRFGKYNRVVISHRQGD